MIRLLSHRVVQIMLLLLLLGVMIAIRYIDPAPVQRWRQLTFDTYNRLIPRPPGQGVMIVDIDEESLRRYGQWPWPRPLVAQIPEILHGMGARSVAFDVVFAEPDRTSPALVADSLPQTPEMEQTRHLLKTLPSNDDVFAEKIGALGNVVTGFCSTSEGQQTSDVPVLKGKFLNEGQKADPLKFIKTVPSFTVSLPGIVDRAAGNGSFTTFPEQDGIIRQAPLLIGHRQADGQVKMYPSLAAEAVRVALQRPFYKVKSFGEVTQHGYGIQSVSIGDYTVPTDLKGFIQIYYSGHRPELYIPAWKLLTQQVPQEMVKDKIILVGTSAIGLLDLRSSPLDPVLPGVEINAEIVEQILGGKFLNRPNYFNGLEQMATGAFCLLIISLAPFIGTGALALLGASVIATSTGGALYAYQHFGYLLDVMYPALSIIVIYILASILNNLRSEMEGREVRKAFGLYISPALMEELAANPDKLKLGGEVRELSVMFSDIRNFTTIAEQMDPADLIRMMNDFLTPMTSCVLDNRGTIDKYIGDAMMAFWNAPLDDADHARHACKTALLMLASLKPVNETLRLRTEQHHKPFIELTSGIGIHTGTCSVGNMGSKQRFAYSALGDTVNLASRLEGQTKVYGVSTIISAATRQQAPEFAAIEIDLLIVKGRLVPERIYTLLGDAAVAQTPAFQEFATTHEKMLATYRGQKWDEAITLAEQCAKLREDLSSLYGHYIQRILAFKETPPPASWQGVWVAKDK